MVRWYLAIALIAIGSASVGAQDARRPDAPPPPTPTNVVTKAPKLLQAVAPDYPPAALAAGKTASVKVKIRIDDNGIVTGVDVLEKVGDGFDEAAVAAAMQYVFDPAEIDGKPAPIAVETVIHFVIEQQEEPDPVVTPPPVKGAPQDTGPPNHAGNASLPVTIEGVVVERGTRRKLAGVIVSIVELGLDAVTGVDGDFYFHGVAAGKYKVLAIDQKFDRLERTVEIAKREKLEVRLWMRPRGGNPYETVVEGEREVLEVTKRTLQRQQFTSVPGTFGDPIRVIQTLPGMQRAPFGLGLLLVRGSNPDDTGIYVDGHEVPSLFHFLGGPSIFNAEMLESIDLYPGGFPARFGRKHGGAVALELRPTKSDGIHGSAKVDFIDSGLYLRAPVTKDVSFAFAGRRSYIDAFLGFVLPEPPPGGQRIVTPIYYDYAGRVDWNLKEEGRLSLFAIGSSDTLRVLDQDPESAVSTDLSTAVKFFRVIGTYARSLGGDLKLSVSPAWGRDSITFTGAQAEAAGPFTSIGITSNSLSYRARVHGKLNPRLTLDTGLDILSRITRYDALIPIDDTLINAQGVDIPPSKILRGASTLGIAGHIDLGIDVNKKLRLIPSLRLDSYMLDGVNVGTIDPRIVGRYAISPTFTAKAYLGEFSQPPQPEAVDRRFGNPNVRAEHATHMGLGYEWKPDRLWTIDSEIYYVRRRDVVVFSNELVANEDGTFSQENFVNSGRRDSYGLEMLIKREISERMFGWLSYTFSRASQRRNPDSAWVKGTFDQPHVLNAVGSWKPGRGFELGVRLQVASGRPDTPVIGATYDADTGNYVPVRGELRSTRTPLYRQLDVRAEKVWLYNTWSLGLYLDIINVTNAENVEAIQYDYRYKESSPVTGFPILPTLGIRGDVVKRLAVIIALLTGCTVFEDPTVVLDLRVLAMTAEISDPNLFPSRLGPDQVVDVDLEMPMPAEILEQLRPTTVCALVADPDQNRPLRWGMTLCLLDDEGRCDRELPFIELGAGIIQDPELASSAQRPCSSIEPAAYPSTILAMLREAVKANPVQALGGIDYTVVFTVGAVEDRATDVYATKHLRISPRIPAERQANLNPSFEYVDAAQLGGIAVSLPGTPTNSPGTGRCAELLPRDVPTLNPGARLTLFPIEPEGTREDYVVPTLDGKTAMLSETVTYQWFATHGSWSDEFTGGGHDVLGNQSLLGSDWLAPQQIAGNSLIVSLWMIQRDERYGVSFFETCVEIAQ